MSEPLKVSISPKAMSTLWCISPVGTATNPHASNAHPKAHIATESMSWVFLIGAILDVSHYAINSPRTRPTLDGRHNHRR